MSTNVSAVSATDAQVQLWLQNDYANQGKSVSVDLFEIGEDSFIDTNSNYKAYFNRDYIYQKLVDDGIIEAPATTSAAAATTTTTPTIASALDTLDTAPVTVPDTTSDDETENDSVGLISPLNLLNPEPREQVSVTIENNGYKFTYNPNIDMVMVQQDGFARVTSLKNGQSWTTDTGATITFDELKAAIQSNNATNISNIFAKAKETVEFQDTKSSYNGLLGLGFGATDTTTTNVKVGGYTVTYTLTTNRGDGSVNAQSLIVVDDSGNRTVTRNDDVNQGIASAMSSHNEAALRSALGI